MATFWKTLLPTYTCYKSASLYLEASWNLMAHAQKPDFVFRRNGRVHLNRQGRHFSRLLAAEMCVEYWLPTPFASFPFTSPPVHHRLSSHFNWSLPHWLVSHNTVTQYDSTPHVIVMCSVIYQRDGQYTCNVKLRRVRVTNIAVKKQSQIFWGRVCILSCPSR